MAAPRGKPFVKGQSGNPLGRPKRKPLTDELLKLLKAKSDGSKYTNAHMVAWKLIQMAKAGKVDAARLVWEYVEGKPTQPVTFDLDAAAERLAAEHGIDKGRLIDLTRRIAERVG